MVKQGSDYKIGWYEETTWNQAPAGTDTSPITYNVVGKIESISFEISPTVEGLYDIGSRDVKTFYDGRREYGMSLEFLLTDKSILSSLLGGKSITVWLNDGGNDILLSGLVLDSMELSVAIDEAVTVSLDLVGGGLSTTAPSYASLPDQPSDIPVMFKDVSVSQDGSDISTKVQELSVEVSESPETIYAFNSVEPQKIVFGTREVSGSITLELVDLSELNDVLNGTEHNLSITLGTLGTLDVSGVRYEAYGQEIAPEDLVWLPLDFLAKSVSLS